MPGMGSAPAVSPYGVVVGSQPMQGPNPHASYAFSPDDAGQLLTFSCACLRGVSNVLLFASASLPGSLPLLEKQELRHFQVVPSGAAAAIKGVPVA